MCNGADWRSKFWLSAYCLKSIGAINGETILFVWGIERRVEESGYTNACIPCTWNIHIIIWILFTLISHGFRQIPFVISKSNDHRSFNLLHRRHGVYWYPIYVFVWHCSLIYCNLSNIAQGHFTGTATIMSIVFRNGTFYSLFYLHDLFTIRPWKCDCIAMFSVGFQYLSMR